MVVFKINVIVVRLMNINRFKLIMKVFTVDQFGIAKITVFIINITLKIIEPMQNGLKPL